MIEGELISLGLRLGAAVAEAIVKAINGGDVETVKALGVYLPSAEYMRALDLALQQRQRLAAAQELAGNTGARE